MAHTSAKAGNGGRADCMPAWASRDVLVAALVVGLARGIAVVDEGPWALAFSAHALARLRRRWATRLT